MSVIGLILLSITLVAGLVTIFMASPKQGYTLSSSRPMDVMLMSVGVATVLSGLVWSAFLFAAGRIVRLFELVELRQFVEREARLRGEVGRPTGAALEPPASPTPAPTPDN